MLKTRLYSFEGPKVKKFLSDDKVQILAIKAKVDDECRNFLIENYTPLISNIAFGYVKFFQRNEIEHISLDEAVQAGRLGVDSAIDSYDPKTNVPFVKYVPSKIKFKIKDENRAFLRVRSAFSRDKSSITYKIGELFKEFYNNEGRPPTVYDIETRLGKVAIPAFKALSLIHMLKRPKSLSEIILEEQSNYDGSEHPKSFDYINKEEELIIKRELIENLLKRLTPLKRGMIIDKFLNGMTLKEISQYTLIEGHKVGETRVCKILKEALHELREFAA
ncbi:MAG TPA: sigma-70 family RNA polymerase sigma factor [Candidatus Nanoarchaeia archaeon]|nr:sigma-70 family RNA polymerase sigma factor [Candidatus Nanoarchaeia archaeon]